MHVEPFIPTPKVFLAVFRGAGMSAAVRFCAAMLVLMTLMFIAPSIIPGAVGALVAHVLAVAVIGCVIGVLASILLMWAPAHDELIRRRGEPLHLGIRFQWHALADSFFSVADLRATPPPRVVHR